MIVRPWKLGDTERIDLQPAQEYLRDVVDVGVDLSEVSEAGLAWTAEHDGQVLAVWGVIPQWQNRALCWAVMGKTAGRHFVPIHRECVRFLDRLPFRRIEAHVDVGFSEGVRWMKMMGFEMEAYLRAFRPDGADMLQFARIRSWHS